MDTSSNRGLPSISIKNSLTRHLLVSLSAILVCSGLILGAVVRSRMISEFDRTLLTKANAIAALTAREGNLIEFDITGTSVPGFDIHRTPDFFQILIEKGPTITRSDSMKGRDLPVFPSSPGVPLFRNIVLPDESHGRLLQLLVPLRTESEEVDHRPVTDEKTLYIPIPASLDYDSIMLSITAAQTMDSLDAVLLSVYGTIAVLDMLIIFCIIYTVRISTTRGLKPLKDLNDQIRQIGPDGLETRIKIEAIPEELIPVQQTTNALLDRLQEAFSRERGFSSDVAHELRTPVAELRSLCEVGARWPTDAETMEQFFEDAGDIAARMERIVNALLMLTRCDSGRLMVDPSPNRLIDLVSACWERMTSSSEGIAERIEFEIDPNATVTTDASLLDIVLQNLIQNALTYSSPGSPIRCFTESSVAGIGLVFENQVAMLDGKDISHLFDRFWRKESSRTGGDHVGLGMSIVQALVDCLDIEIHVALTPAGVFRACLSFVVPKTCP